MNHQRSILLTLGLASTSLFNQAHSFDYSYKNIAFASCATVGAVLALKATYDYLFSIDDAQEFNHAIQLCHANENLCNSIEETYQNELRCDTTHGFSQSIWHAITAHMTTQCRNPHYSGHASYYPWWSYEKSLQTAMQELKDIENKILAKKIYIFERRIQLKKMLIHADEQQAIEISSTIESYDFVFTEIERNAKATFALLKMLRAIKVLVTSHPQYIIEKQQMRIDELERSAAYAHPPVLVLPCHTQVHNTYVTTFTPTPIIPLPPKSINDQENESKKKKEEMIDHSAQSHHQECTARVQTIEDDTLSNALYTAGDTFNG